MRLFKWVVAFLYHFVMAFLELPLQAAWFARVSYDVDAYPWEIEFGFEDMGDDDLG